MVRLLFLLMLFSLSAKAQEWPSKPVRIIVPFSAGGFAYGSSGTGGTAHLACELLCQQAGISMQHIPYKGGGQAITDVVGGQIPLVCTAVATAHGFLKSGKLKGLGISSAQRTPAAPEVPTFVESGLPRLVVNSWMGIPAPAKTPAPVVGRLQHDIAAVLQLPDVRE